MFDSSFAATYTHHYQAHSFKTVNNALWDCFTQPHESILWCLNQQTLQQQRDLEQRKDLILNTQTQRGTVQLNPSVKNVLPNMNMLDGTALGSSAQGFDRVVFS